MSTTTKSVAPLVVWTLFVWSSRIRNIWSDDDLSTGGQVLRTGYAVVFLVLGAAMAVHLWQHRRAWLGRNGQHLLTVFVAWTIGFWLVRGIGIIVDDHTLSFTVVHTVLMAFSIGLALVAGRASDRRSISSSVAAAR